MRRGQFVACCRRGSIAPTACFIRARITESNQFEKSSGWGRLFFMPGMLQRYSDEAPALTRTTA
jgi:hypothetical protein